jgi:BMFP domain-containing protein YqiC
MFGQVLEKLDSYFGRAFLLSRYTPWLLCVIANLAIACIEFPEVRAFVLQEYGGLAASKAVDLAVALLVIWVVAYTTAPAAQAVTAILEGGWIPRWVAVFLIAGQARRREKLDNAFASRRRRRDDMPGFHDVIGRLLDDRAIGAQLRAIDDPDAITRAEALIAGLRLQRWLNCAVSREEFEAAREALSKALKANCAEKELLLRPEDTVNAERLDDLHTEVLKVLAPYVLDIAEQLENRAKADQQSAFARYDLAPTRLGNDAAALRSYCETRYGIQFELFWPRFLLVVQNDSKIADAIAAAKIQLDFSILCLTLAALSTLIWIFVIGALGRSLWTVLVVFVLGPVAIAVWLEIVHTSYASFAEVARSAIDLRRFSLLEDLRRPLPVSTDAEKRIWEAAARLALLDEHGANIAFRHPTK